MRNPKGGIRRRDVLRGAGAVAGVGAVTAVTGFPHVARAQANPIRVGMPTILSGRVAILGESSRAAAQLAINEVNEAGGIAGREIELVARDSKGQPDEAARVTRDLINSDNCEIIIDAEASSGSFAVQEVIRELPVLCIHTCSETSSLSADPDIRVETAFRCARQGIHDAIGGGRYAADIARENGYTRWMTCSPDYAYGRDNTSEFLEYLQHFEPSVEVVDQAWPKLFEPDYTSYVTRILQVSPQAIYSALWGGDLVSFLEQAAVYGMFGQGLTLFSGGLADPPVLNAVTQLPDGLNSVYRYDAEYPDTEANAQFNERYGEIHSDPPTNWSWQNYLACQFMFEALRATEGDTEGAALAEVIRGMQIDSPFSPGGTVTMRAEDQTIIDYPVAWGRTVSSPAGMTDWVAADWDEIQDLETEWKERQGYL